MDSICRCCAGIKKIENFVTLDLGLNSKLEKCCQVTIQENDGLPQNVCVDCAQNLEDSWKFVTKVHEAQESLQNFFLRCTTSTSNKNESSESKTKILRKISKPIYQNLNRHPIAKTPSQDILAVDDNIEGTSASNYEDGDINSSIKEEYQLTEEFEESKLDIDHNDIDNIFDDDSTNFDIEIIPMKEPNPNQQIDNQDEEVHLIEVLETWTDYQWSCKICSMTFGNSNDIQNHSKEVHTDDMPKFSCIDCSKNFDEYNKYLNHIKAHHKPNLMLCCDVCSQFFENYKILANHRKMHEEHGVLSLCEMCGKAFKNEKKLQIHSTCHQTVEGKCKLTCDTCGKKFSSRPNLKAHQKIHAGIKEFICDQCGKSFVQKANLAEHMLTHTTDVPYECTDCHKKFKTSIRLAKHRSVHLNIKPYKCEECNREFREKDSLRVHMRIHTGVMPYECDFCGKKFRFRSILTTHRHQHTGVRPYSCQDCNHHFTNWPNYNKHMKRVHGIDTSLKKQKAEADTAIISKTSIKRK